MIDNTVNSDLHSPDDIARHLPVARMTDTIVIAVLGVILVAALAYLVAGRLPVTVSGHSVVVDRYSVIAVESGTSGRIASWKVRPGDNIERGQLLAVIEQPLLKQQIDAARNELTELLAAQEKATALHDRNVDLERQVLQNKRDKVTQRIRVLEDETQELRNTLRLSISQERKFFAAQEAELLRMKELESRQDTELKAQLGRAEQLRTKELLTEEDLFAAREATTDQQVVLADIDVKHLELNRSRVAAAERYLQSAKETKEREQAVENLRRELLQTLTDTAKLDQEVSEANYRNRLDHARLQRHLQGLNARLREHGQIRSPATGRVLELTVGAGAVVRPGNEVAVIDRHEDSEALEIVAYYSNSDGKKIKPGMSMELIMPSVINPTGSTLPLASKDSRTLLAAVRSVSKLPVTPEAAALTIGHDYLAQQMIGAGSRIEVVADLSRDSEHPSGYLWASGGGVEFPIAAGTSLVARTIIRRHPPLAFAVPALRDWEGF
ncbi:MAG: NHLP bacteriocin system secretion protein [Acidiferrobacteraceae bacterium]|nr:NHLP bacteriocin system secretion protein [Acidiferrobacteraceae bacterium]MDP6411814.1 NHLP bacteriocin system secretion protein [Arenicellales bacterium]MDP6530744.1 NHLP bacteriocin system secretion protein [Arenicellales bacterium]MDP6855017.1 NHLP bacteriocin system secretion protein [Arenicellales bacterium]|tara:strand:+ start:7646 stop:9133 length:1488 start_codon:yes stop_codon:yes gene_type:complete